MSAVSSLIFVVIVLFTSFSAASLQATIFQNIRAIESKVLQAQYFTRKPN